MITLLLSDGLGNQMFQYAFARCLSLRRGDVLRISKYYCTHENQRPYSLNHLSISDDVRFMNSVQEFLSLRKFGICLNIHKIFHGSRENDFYGTGIINIHEAFDCYKPEFMRPDFGEKNLIVSGFFQTWKYFTGFEDKIRSELSVSTPPSGVNVAMIKEIEDCESVCVHVRRGDYVKLKWNEVCSYEYYDRAIKFMKEKLNSPVFYFFSNDHSEIGWLKNNWKFPEANIKYVDLNNPDYEELRLMYSCKNFIVANSSFSWWGAYLSRNKNKIVCAPSKWLFEIQTEKSNIIPPDWNIISVERDNEC